VSFNKLSLSNKSRSVIRFSSIVLALIFMLLPLLACDSGEPSTTRRDADYGSYGKELAETLADDYPRRIPGSDQEAEAAQYIFDQLTLLGYSPEIQTFTFFKGSRSQKSQNVIARVSGSGFSYSPQFEQDRSEEAPDKVDDRVLIIGAHYDTPDFTLEADEDGKIPRNTADGIHNNASGVAAVMTAAKQMLQEKPGYNIQFVFFGAGSNQQEGAQAFLDSLSDNELERIDAMVNIGPIYAGDKIYAHAGQNSVRTGSEKSYEMRRKLYQVTDIFFDYVLNTQNNYAVFTNQTDYYMPYTPSGASVEQAGLYREWTVIESDHTPFDRAGIPIVFMESGDYNVDKSDLGKENTSPRFAPSKGMISGTLFDESDYLEEFFRTVEKDSDIDLAAREEQDSNKTETTGSGTQEVEEKTDEDRLTKRINNTAFILVQLTRRGPIDYVFDN
jgi:alkaline phosphatase isozyme conversion protein